MEVRHSSKEQDHNSRTNKGRWEACRGLRAESRITLYPPSPPFYFLVVFGFNKLDRHLLDPADLSRMSLALTDVSACDDVHFLRAKSPPPTRLTMGSKAVSIVWCWQRLKALLHEGVDTYCIFYSVINFQTVTSFQTGPAFSAQVDKSETSREPRALKNEKEIKVNVSRTEKKSK